MELNAKKILRQFKSDKIINSNIIIDILKEFESKDVQRMKKAITIATKIFCQLLRDGDLKPRQDSPVNILSAKAKYDSWLHDKYEAVHEQLLWNLQHSEMRVQHLSLIAIFRLCQKEMNHPLTKEKTFNISFPLKRLKNLLVVLISETSNNSHLIRTLKEFLEYSDFLLVCLSVLHEIIKAKKNANENHIYIRNLFALLELITLPLKDSKPLQPQKLFVNCDRVDCEENERRSLEFSFPYSEGQSIFSAIWEIVLNFDFPPDIYKRCLILIPEKVLIHLDRPVRLTDFFMNAYNHGGAASVMALQGVFILVNQYNLEYPDFYDKVYALLEPAIFQAKYKPRFFMLCDKFLSSTLLPEYIVAAFIKRMSRLMLLAPSSSLILLLKFVVNLLLKYPSLRRMINNPNVTSMEDDPYLPDEPKPQFCKAGESSLWEVASLRHHSLCGISKAANFITRNLPDVEHDLSKYVENTYEEILEKANKIREPRVFTTIYEPKSLFTYSDDDMSESWIIS